MPNIFQYTSGTNMLYLECRYSLLLDGVYYFLNIIMSMQGGHVISYQKTKTTS